MIFFFKVFNIPVSTEVLLTTDELTAVSDADTSADRDVAAGIFALKFSCIIDK